jgi:hypothetical protein
MSSGNHKQESNGYGPHMTKPLTVEHVSAFDVHVLHRAGALREALVSLAGHAF